MHKPREERIVEAAGARAVRVVVEVAQHVEALAGVELIRRQRGFPAPPLSERAVPLSRYYLPARVRQRARRAEVVALRVRQRCLRPHLAEITLLE